MAPDSMAPAGRGFGGGVFFMRGTAATCGKASFCSFQSASQPAGVATALSCKRPAAAGDDRLGQRDDQAQAAIGQGVAFG